MTGRVSDQRLVLWTSVLMAVALGACKTASSLAPVQPGAPGEVWAQLQRIREELPGFRSYLRMKVEAGPVRRTFNARLALDTQGRSEMTILTPLGTAAMTIFAEGRNATVVNHLEHSYWQGAYSELLAGLGIGGGDLNAAEFASLLIGLPANPAGSQTVGQLSEIERIANGWTYTLGQGGLLSAVSSPAEIQLVFRYQPAAFPAARVTVQVENSAGANASSARLDVEHLETHSESAAIKPPKLNGLKTGGIPRLIHAE